LGKSLAGKSEDGSGWTSTLGSGTSNSNQNWHYVPGSNNQSLTENATASEQDYNLNLTM
jgi:hypothetical protein